MGFSPQDVIGKTNAELGYPESLVQRWRDAIDRVFETWKTHRIEYQFIDGSWIDCMFMPELQADGQVKTVLTASRNILILSGPRIVGRVGETIGEIIDFLPDAIAVVDQAYDRDGPWNNWTGFPPPILLIETLMNPDVVIRREATRHRSPGIESDMNVQKKNSMNFAEKGNAFRCCASSESYRQSQAIFGAVAAPLRDAKGSIIGAIESIAILRHWKTLEKKLTDLSDLEKNVVRRADDCC
jgi:hypothetical protein